MTSPFVVAIAGCHLDAPAAGVEPLLGSREDPVVALPVAQVR